MKYYSIGQFSKITNVPITKLRYYDSLGLLKPILVKENNYRYYTYNQIQQLEWIKLLKETGFNLAEIEHLENKQIDYQFILSRYDEFLVSKKQEIQDLEYNYHRICKKLELKQELLKKKGYYWRELIQGYFLIDKIKEQDYDVFNLTEKLYNYMKLKNLVESLSIIQTGFIFMDNSQFIFAEITNHQDLESLDEKMVFNVQKGKYYCCISKIQDIKKNITKMLQSINKKDTDVKHIICDKLLNEPLKEHTDLFEIQILFN